MLKQVSTYQLQYPPVPDAAWDPIFTDMRLTFSSNKDFPGRARQDAISDRRIGNADTLEEYGVSPVDYAYDWRD